MEKRFIHSQSKEKEIMTISPAQIRAARAMKNWNQAELAKRTNLAAPTITNIELEKQKPGQKTLNKIRTIFEESGIEFIDNDGVRKKKDSIKVIRGQEEYIKFFDFLYEHTRTNGGPIYLSNVEEEYYEKWYPNFFDSDYYHNMRKIQDRFDFRIIAKEGNTYLPATYAQYRWMPKEEFSPVPFEVFGNYLAIKLLFLDEPIIFLIHHKETAELYRKKFLEQWDRAIVPSQFNGRKWLCG